MPTLWPILEKLQKPECFYETVQTSYITLKMKMLRPFTLPFLIFCLCAFNIQDIHAQQPDKSLIHMQFPPDVPLETTPSSYLASLNIYKSIMTEVTQYKSQQELGNDGFLPDVEFNHFKKTIAFEKNLLSCEERTFSGASLRMSYFCEIQIDPRWLTEKNPVNKISFVGPFAETVSQQIQPNQYIQCKKNFFTTQCQILINPYNITKNNSFTVFAQRCSNPSQTFSLNLQQLALNQLTSQRLEELRNKKISLLKMENQVESIWKTHQPKLTNDFKLNIQLMLRDLKFTKENITEHYSPYFLALPNNCEVVPVLSYDSELQNYHVQESIWAQLPLYDQNWIILHSALKKTLLISNEDKLRSDDWLFNLLNSEVQKISFKNWTLQIFDLGSQVLETPFLNSTALVSANHFFEFSTDETHLKKATLVKLQSFSLFNQKIEIKGFYNLFNQQNPREIFITRPFTTQVDTRIFDWQANQRYYFHENGLVESGLLAFNPFNPSLQIKSQSLNLQIIGGRYFHCQNSNIKFDSKGQVIALCGAIGSVFWNDEWIQISKAHPIYLKNENEMTCGTSEKTILNPINEYSFKPLPKYHIPPCGGF